MIVKKTLLYILGLWACLSYAEENLNSSSKTLTFITGLPKPPYILNDGQTGLQLDVISKAFACKNYSIQFINMPLGRNITSFNTLDVDGVITLPANYEYPGMYLSKPYITYENVVVTLSDNRIKLNTLKDLSMLSFGAFQNAKRFLNKDYVDVVKSSIEYREFSDQSKQIEMLYNRSLEAIILDVDILKYFLKTHSAKIYQKNIMIHNLFEKNSYSVGFKSIKIKNTFDEGMECIKANGEYQAILSQYGH